jgi:hypothetical protein
MTTTLSGYTNPAIRAVALEDIRVADVVTTADTLATWFKVYGGLVEFAVIDRRRRVLLVTVSRPDRTLITWERIRRSEPEQYVGEDGRSWGCNVGFSTKVVRISGFPTKIECTLAARQWFIAYGINPDSPGGWN